MVRKNASSPPTNAPRWYQKLVSFPTPSKRGGMAALTR